MQPSAQSFPIRNVKETVIIELTQLFSYACIHAFPDQKELIVEGKLPVEITRSTQKDFGHYQCNSAMKAAKILQKNPRKIAEEWKHALLKTDQESINCIEKVEIAGPGFMNIWLAKRYLVNKLEAILKRPSLGIEPLRHQKVAVDFSSPNTAKEMHVGHLRSTIIGDCLARVMEFLGHDVLRLNHIGDWGTAFGMLIAYMKEKHPEAINGTSQATLTDLVQYYRESKKLFDEDPHFKKRAQLQVVALQQGDKEAFITWQIICAISRKAYQEIYDLLDVHLQERGESFYNSRLKSVVDDLDSKGLITVSEGAKCVFLEGFINREGEPLPLMVQKSDGGYLYATTDIAALVQRIQEEKADRIIYVTDAGQASHFAMVFSAAEKAGYLDRSTVEVNHVPFGLVLGVDGKKFRTRSGETERLIDLLTAAIEKAKEIIDERNPDWTEEERQNFARILGIGAVKYADLSCNRMSDYVFSYEKMLRFEGNTAAFLLYAYVRINGIKRKVKANVEYLLDHAHIQLEHPSEISLALKVAQFSETIDQVATELLPNRLTDYLFELAEEFNAFFRDCRVEGSQEQDSRLLLAESVAYILKTGLSLLGLKTVDRM